MSDTNRLDDVDRLRRLGRVGAQSGHGRAAESLELFARLASRLLEVPVALVSLVGEDRQVFAGQTGLPEPWSARGETPLSHSFCQYVVGMGGPLVISDAREHPLVRDNLAIPDLGVVAYAGIPLHAGGECVGALCAIDTSPRDWSDQDLALLKDIAGAATTELELRWMMAEREVVHEAVSLSEERFRALIEAMAEGVVVRQGDGEIVACNPAAERILGLTADQMMGRSSLDPRWSAIRGDGSPFLGEDHPGLVTLRTGQPMRDVIMGVGYPEGGLSWISISSQLLSVTSASAGRTVLSTFADVTDRLAAEEALRADALEQVALTRVATLAASGADPSEVFAVAAEEAARVLDGAAGGVVRSNLEGAASVVGTWAGEGMTLPSIGSPVPADGPTAVAAALRERRTARVDGYARLPRPAGESIPYTAGVAAPVLVGGRMWGAITVAAAGQRGFSEAAERRLERFADLVGLAVTSAEAREALAALALTDELTGLPNTRAFRTRLEQEVVRARRHGRPLSLIMLDIDRFKAINDAHGHPTGDRVIAEVARHLRDFGRREEMVARVGGEEFAWILPETEAVNAHAAADRARRRIRSARFSGVGPVTISAGVSDLPGDATLDDLVEAADTALYAAKSAGRDRVHTHDETAGAGG